MGHPAKRDFDRLRKFNIEAKRMNGQKTIELRSIGQPRAGLPAFFIWVAAMFVVCAAVTGGAFAQGAPAQAGAVAPKTAGQAFKNIKVLTDIPADDLIPAMQFITASLGKECEFCHVQGAFEKDDKRPKQTARKMMEMMFAINKDNFEGHREVTCYTCHQGNAHPMATPVVMAAETQPGEMHPAEDDEHHASGPPAEELFDKYLKAVGGAAAVEKINSRVMKGTITFGDRNLPIDIYSKDPEKRVSITHTPDGDSVTGFNGHEGWLGMPKGPIHGMHGPDIDGASIDADLHLAAHLKDMFSKAEVRGTEKIGDSDAYFVVGQREGKTPLRLYFDEKTGLLVRLVRFGETPLGRLPTQIDYADYRDAGGVKIPYRWTLARPSGRFTIQVSDVKENVPVEDSKFEKPAQEQKPAK
jgi:photosynthetic reaction center cytochrome c subunit